MQEIIAHSFSDFDKALAGIPPGTLYRGVSDKNYQLIPSLFRVNKRNWDKLEDQMMWIFKTHAIAYLEKTPGNDLEWLTFAQHHGLPTRLLDWSLSALTACFFAVQKETNKDGAVYVYDIPTFTKSENISLDALDKITAFMPSQSTSRIQAQSAVFTIHPTIIPTLNQGSIKKVIIPSAQKIDYMERLITYGTNHGTIFPGLDGLAEYIKYQTC